MSRHIDKIDTTRNDLTSQINRAEGCLLGLAVGDALGVPLEFRRRDMLPLVDDLIGGGCFKLPAGAWTDDMSMALCLGYSLVEKQKFDAVDQLNKYVDWHEDGYCSSTGKCFDIGGVTLEALVKYQRTGQMRGINYERSAGNGSIMRLAPIPIFYHLDRNKAIEYAINSSVTTHAHPLCLEGCALLSAIIWDALNHPQISKQALLQNHHHLVSREEWQPIVNMDYRYKTREEIISSGYVVASLEAALWAFWHTNSFEEALILAANLADDSDTVAAICGQIAGAYYGVDAIPARWLEKLYDRETIRTLANNLATIDNNH